MMDREQFLLIKLAEEASEVAQIALKTAQFGMEEVKPGHPYSNRQRIHQEINDLLAIINMLNRESAFAFRDAYEFQDEKIKRVNHYYEYSQGLGKVE